MSSWKAFVGLRARISYFEAELILSILSSQTELHNWTDVLEIMFILSKQVFPFVEHVGINMLIRKQLASSTQSKLADDI